jgi:chromosome segregation ATPase
MSLETETSPKVQTTNVEELNNKIQSLQEEIAQKNFKIEKKRQKVNNLKKEINSLNQKITEQKEKLDALNAELTTIRHEYEELNKLYQQSKDEHETQMRKTAEKLVAHTNEIKELKSNLEATQRAKELLTEELTTLRNTINEKKSVSGTNTTTPASTSRDHEEEGEEERDKLLKTQKQLEKKVKLLETELQELLLVESCLFTITPTDPKYYRPTENSTSTAFKNVPIAETLVRLVTHIDKHKYFNSTNYSFFQKMLNAFDNLLRMSKHNLPSLAFWLSQLTLLADHITDTFYSVLTGSLQFK